MKNRCILGVLLCLLCSCQLKPEQIEYGKEQCAFCSMAIVDRTHAAQYVTEKGKQYKFDAIECMVRKVGKSKHAIHVMLVADYGKPGTMIDAPTAFYLISDSIRSPMGENLSALASQAEANKLVLRFGGGVYTWDEVQRKLSDK